MAITHATIQHRRGALKDFDATKMKSGELAVTTDGSRKVLAAFAPGDVKELASKEDVEQTITDGIESIKTAETEALNNIGTGVDSSLTQKGKAADAKATGDKITELNRKIIQVVPDEKITEAVNNYLDENPPTTGATAEQAAQIEQNKNDLVNSKEAIKELSDKKITKFYASNLGATILNDSDNGKIADMKVYGKNYQFQGDIELEDGTTVTVPSPDYPQEIQSVVNPVVKVCENLLNKLSTDVKNGVTCTDNGDGSYTLSGTALKTTVLSSQLSINLEGGYYSLNGCPKNGSASTYKLDITDDHSSPITDFGNGTTGYVKKGIYNFRIVIYPGTNVDNLIFKPVLYLENTQSVTLSYILNGIPVSEAGNVTIDGQQYMADYVDVERGKRVKIVDDSKLDPSVSIADNTDLLLDEPIEVDLTSEEVQMFHALVTYYPTTNVFVTSEQLDGYTEFNYPISLAEGWNYVKQQLGDTRDYIYDIDLQSAEAYVNSEYAVTLTELEI